MQEFSSFIDPHCHLSDLRMSGHVHAVIKKARARRIEYFMQGGVGPEDWERQLALAKSEAGIIPCFGLHPYWVAEHSLDDCEAALNILAKHLPHSLAIGEMGLDLRPHIAKDSEPLQVEVFEDQIQMAEALQKPMVLHLVQAHDLALRIFDVWGVPKARGFIHSFNGSYQKAMDFINRDLLISIGGPVCRPGNDKLKNAAKQIPLESLLIESDSPDQAPPDYPHGNEPSSLWSVAKTIGELRDIEAEELLQISRANFMRLFGLESLDGYRKILPNT
jgi:TatD DNase family protein